MNLMLMRLILTITDKNIIVAVEITFLGSFFPLSKIKGFVVIWIPDVQDLNPRFHLNQVKISCCFSNS